MSDLAKFNPHNAQEFENEMRALIVSHMGLGQGNPTQWVVNAVCEAFQRGFGLGFAAGQGSSASPPRATEILRLPVLTTRQAAKLTLAERVDNEPRK